MPGVGFSRVGGHRATGTRVSGLALRADRRVERAHLGIRPSPDRLWARPRPSRRRCYGGRNCLLAAAAPQAAAAGYMAVLVSEFDERGRRLVTRTLSPILGRRSGWLVGPWRSLRGRSSTRRTSVITTAAEGGRVSVHGVDQPMPARVRSPTCGATTGNARWSRSGERLLAPLHQGWVGSSSQRCPAMFWSRRRLPGTGRTPVRVRRAGLWLRPAGRSSGDRRGGRCSRGWRRQPGRGQGPVGCAWRGE